MATTQQITSAAQLLEAPGLGRCELIRGELIMMSPAGFQHGHLGAKLAQILLNFVEPRSLGAVTGSETGFLVARDPENETVTVYRSPGEAAILGVSDTLPGGDVLPGFAVPVRQVFAQ